MEYTRRLRAEIARLRELLEDHGIDPEPYVPPPPQFGPPTEWEWRLAELFKKSAAHAATMLLTQKNDWLFTAGEKPLSALGVRLPMDFTVRS